MSGSIASNRSTLKEFLASIATIQGDLSNITAPPFVLAEHSTVELPQYWADHLSLFVAQALEADAEKRALLILKWFLGSLRNQQYAGRKEQDSKKPLNAFLGELFLGGFHDDGIGETKLISEQVSHHPPVTACYLWNDRQGIRAEGFTQQEITFSGSVNIKQKGYAILHIDHYKEDYLIPVPNVKVKGIISGTPYPELVGNYCIVSPTALVSEIKFEGKGLLGGGSKNGFEARLYRADASSDDLYTAKGQWNGSFNIQNARTVEEIDTLNINMEKSIPITVADLSDQDPWESRKAWGGVIDALGRGDMKGTTDAKSDVETGQRQMRRDEEARGEKWQRVFYRRQTNDPLLEKLSAAGKDSFTVDPAGGIWKVDKDAIDTQKPYHGNLLPTRKVFNNQRIQRNEANGPGSGYNSPKTEQPARSERFHGESNGAVRGPDAQAGGMDKRKLEDIQVEEMLRAKYQSSSR
ncbi:Oxysterol-binding protein [Trematosphaeria pertusa]|uniref:Oxysterol-binding protein n=1 Tax=Trematosphaeria pertusa TaxID=390896 RepID=A0A6A6IEQ5_9PLEO|nr:Oxysterol-binding protein [Trematosphaeria pertusa]KAF2248687.1 Oxysterol-binding protein [Trematosphaeria pertusa]